MADITIAQGELNKTYEDALLGFIMMDPDKLLEVSEILPSADYFSDPNNKAAYEIFLKLFREDRFPGSPMLLIAELYNGAGGKQRFESEDATARYVNALLNAPTIHAQKFVPSAFVEYAEYIKWQKDKRDIQTVGAEMISGVEKIGVAEREEFVSGIEDSLANVTMNVHGKNGLMHISEITDGLAGQLEKLRRGESLGSGIPTGIDMLDKTLNGLRSGEMVVLAGRPAMGKSLSHITKIVKVSDDGTPVITTMGELQENDYVYNRHGNPVRVTGVFPQGKLEAYKMTFSDGRTAICSDDHIWPYIQNTREKGKRVEKIMNKTLSEMMKQGVIHIKPHEKDDPTRRNRSRFAMPINEAVEMPARKHKISPYVMGVFLGDGCKNNNGLFFLSSELEYHVAQIAAMIGADRYKKKNPGNYSWSFYKDGRPIHVRDIDEAYHELLTNTYCGDKYIPIEYMFDSIENRWELVRGLMDTDGCISQRKIQKKNSMVFSTTSKQLAYDFRSLCNSLGLIAHITENDRRGQVNKSSNGKEYIRKSVEYNVSILCPNSLKPKFFTVEHKLERANRIAECGDSTAKYDRICLKKVEKLPEKQEMVCISVDDPEELFLCNDYLVTHNTTLSMQIAYNVAQTFTDNKKNAVLIFSLEMMEDQLMSRMVATSGRINMQAFMEEYEHFIDDHYYAKAYSPAFEDKMRRKLDTQFERAQIAMKHIESLPIYTSTEAGMSPSSIKSLVMQKKREIERNGEHLALVIIDYLQLMVPGLAKSNASRTEEVGDMSRKVKLLAKEFEVPVLLLAQLNRNADVTERPNLKDLRESGSIEQDADKVMFIWSENADKSPQDFAEIREDAAKREAWRREQMKVTITVAKNRQGETGDCPVIFDKGFQTYLSQSDAYAANNEQYEEFAAKYYQKTRTTDLFWPLREGEIPDELERFREPLVREVPYLTPDGQLITLANDDGNAVKTSMTIQSTPAPVQQAAKPANTAGSGSNGDDVQDFGPLDRSTPAAMPVIDDLESDFEELSDDDDDNAVDASIAEQNEETVAVEDAGESNVESQEIEADSDIVMDEEPDDDDMIDLDELDMLEALSAELES